MAPAGGALCVLFLRAASPGAVFRFVERRFGQSAGERARLDALGLRLSEADAAGGWRMLLGGDDFPDWAESAGPACSEVFPPAVTLLQVVAQEDWTIWRFVVWENGAETARGGGEALPARGLRRWFTSPAAQASADAKIWAASRGLPARLESSSPRLDYATVAQLDARGLLVENGPRLYTFRFGEDGEGTV